MQYPFRRTVEKNPSNIFPAMVRYEIPTTLPRSNSCQSTTTKIIPAAFLRSTSSLDLEILKEFHEQPITQQGSPAVTAAATAAAFRRLSRNRNGIAAVLRSILSLLAFPSSILPTCSWVTTPNEHSITPDLGRKVTGTLFGNRRGAVSFAVQYDSKSKPVFVIEFAFSTATLVKEMSSGLLRIALECEKVAPLARRGGGRAVVRLFGEPTWMMYCNGRQCGSAQARECNEADWHVLNTVKSVSVGAGVIPMEDDGRKEALSEGELMFMRARFERVVGNRDSEAFYMMNPDGNNGPELGIFLLRI